MKLRKIIGLMFLLTISLSGLSACSTTGSQGPQGEQGIQGETGIGIESIEKSGSEGLVDTYTITFTDGTTSTFAVTNGKDGVDGTQGIQGIQGEPGEDGHTPVITIQDGYWYIDGVNTKVLAEGIKGDTGNGVSNVKLTDTKGLIDTYTITYTDGSTSTFTVTNGKDGVDGDQGIQGIQGEPGKDGHTPVITIKNGYWYIDGVNTHQLAQGLKGDTGEKGDKGEQGISVKSINLTNTDGNIDTYTITYSDGKTSTFIVTNGKDGEDGEQGIQGIQGIQGEPGEDGHTPVITIQDGYWYIDGVNTLQVAQGVKGDTGNGISSITKTNTSGLVDTYTITYTDGKTSTFIVTNGKDGEDGKQGIQGIQGIPGEDGHTPVISIGSNENWFIDNTDTGVSSKGDKGDTGKSAYETYIEYHPEYTGTEAEWIEDLVNGNLREKYTVTFNSNGGTAVDTQKVSYGHLVTRPYDPEKTGYLFDGWYLNGESFPFNSYQVYDNVNLYARWKSCNLNLTLNANGGELEYNTKEVIYGTSYTLPTPTKENYVFEGWYYENELCPLSGAWSFSKDDIILTAKWSGTKVTVSEIYDSNVSGGFGNVILNYGEYFNLPVPTILSGDKFIGWGDEDGNIYTDSEGYSTRPSNFKEDISLKAIYYIPISSVGQLISLADMQAGDPELKRTYVLTNDLDFTGVQTESIHNFEGVLDGNGYKITGLCNSLFESIGVNYNSSSKVVVKNITFENYGGSAVVENVYCVDTFEITNIKINSFIKDENNYLEFNGIIAQVGDITQTIEDEYYDYYRVRPNKIDVNNCHILDEFTTIESGIIGHLSYFKDVSVTKCSNYANCKQSAIISSDTYSLSPFEEMGLFIDLSTSKKCTRDAYLGAVSWMFKAKIDSNITVSYCSNYGDATNFISVSAGQSGKYSSDHKIYVDKCSHYVNIDNCVNYGNLYSFFENSMYVDDEITDYAGSNSSGSNSYYKDYGGYSKLHLNDSYNIYKCLNFGEITKLFSSKESLNYTSTVYYPFTASYLFNAGETAESSAITEYGLNSFYEVTSYTNIDELTGLNISSLNQVTADFFEGTFALDKNQWNLSYINITDKYGLPTIIY